MSTGYGPLQNETRGQVEARALELASERKVAASGCTPVVDSMTLWELRTFLTEEEQLTALRQYAHMKLKETPDHQTPRYSSLHKEHPLYRDVSNVKWHCDNQSCLVTKFGVFDTYQGAEKFECKETSFILCGECLDNTEVPRFSESRNLRDYAEERLRTPEVDPRRRRASTDAEAARAAEAAEAAHQARAEAVSAAEAVQAQPYHVNDPQGDLDQEAYIPEKSRSGSADLSKYFNDLTAGPIDSAPAIQRPRENTSLPYNRGEEVAEENENSTYAINVPEDSSADPYTYIVVSEKGLKVRESHDVKSEEVGSLAFGEEVTIIEKRGRRARVVNANISGWTSIRASDRRELLKQKTTFRVDDGVAVFSQSQGAWFPGVIDRVDPVENPTRVHTVYLTDEGRKGKWLGMDELHDN